MFLSDCLVESPSRSWWGQFIRQVFAGTVNTGKPINVQITKISGASMLDQIVKVVREGQTNEHQ
jgi:cation transport ATPase